MPSSLTATIVGLRCELRRSCRRILPAAIAAVVAMMGGVMLVGSLYLRLAESMPASTAAAVTGGSLMALAGVIAVATFAMSRFADPCPVPVAVPIGALPGKLSALAEVLGMAEAAIERDAHAETQLFPLMALLAGCALGASPQLRRTLVDLIR